MNTVENKLENRKQAGYECLKLFGGPFTLHHGFNLFLRCCSRSNWWPPSERQQRNAAWCRRSRAQKIYRKTIQRKLFFFIWFTSPLLTADTRVPREGSTYSYVFALGQFTIYHIFITHKCYSFPSPFASSIKAKGDRRVFVWAAMVNSSVAVQPSFLAYLYIFIRSVWWFWQPSFNICKLPYLHDVAVGLDRLPCSFSPLFCMLLSTSLFCCLFNVFVVKCWGRGIHFFTTHSDMSNGL